MAAMRALLPLLSLVLPAAAVAAPALEPADHAALARSLRDQGISATDLTTADRGGAGLHPVVADALADPRTAPETAHHIATQVALDGAATDGKRWDGVLAVAGQAWGVQPGPVDAPCTRPSGGTLSSQHVAAAEATGARWSKRERNDIAQRLHPELDRLLGGLADDLMVARCLVDAALAPVPAAERPALLDEAQRWLGEVTFEEGASGRLLAAWDTVDRAALLEAARGWVTAIDAASRSLAGLDASAWPASPLIWRIAAGEVWIGSTGANAGAGNPVLLVDPGGDDHWRIRSDARAVSEGDAASVRGWIDLGGDDVWRSGAGGAGAGAFGIGVGLDLAGDDVHEAGPFSVGAGLFGVGVWLDVAGRDRYDVAAGGQGFGLAGLGVLRDQRRDDVYRADRWAQGSALPGGVGVLHDQRGGDRYLLTDDVREEREVAAWETAAVLLPSCHAGCGQGFGAGLGARMGPGRATGLGVLVDDGGDDLYTAGERVQGAGSRGGFGALRDGGGDDSYLAAARAQGAGEQRGVGVLLDTQGADAFLARSESQGWAGEVSVGWLVDLQGIDRYVLDWSGQGAAVGRSGVGVAFDRDGGAFSLEPVAGKASRFPPIGVRVGGQPPGGAVVGMTGASTQRGTVSEVLAALSALGRDAEREALAIGARLGGLTDPAPAEREALVAAVVASARSMSGSPLVRHHLSWLDGLTEGAPLLVSANEELAGQLVGHDDWRVREAAWHTRWRLSRVRDLVLDPTMALAIATEAAVALQKESHPDVRAAAARAAGAFGGPEVAGSLVQGLLTEHLGLRRSAEVALRAVAARTDGVGVARGLYGAASGERRTDPVVREAALRVLGAARQRDGIDVLVAALAGDPGLALAAAEGLARDGGRAARAALKEWLAAHADRAPWIEALLDRP
jgi:hypothetical protein